MPMLGYSLSAFGTHPAVDLVQVVIRAEDEGLYRAAVPGVACPLLEPIIGGDTRQASVRMGLAALAASAPDLVLIHDAARPLVGADVIGRVVAALETASGAVAAVPVADTLKRANASDRIAETVERSGLWSAQTPQGFRFDAILDAHRRAAAAQKTHFTDDAAIAEWAGLDVALVQGSARNMKVTSAEDLVLAERLLAGSPPALEARTGTGFDVHRFTAGDHVWLGGVKIAHARALEGHSDADVALHALTDAILGALGDGDIGEHFPPSDARWKGAASRVFLADAARRVAARYGRISNVDVTILAEAPRIGPHRAAMQAAIAETLGIEATRVGIKATTIEGLGFIGRGEGLAAMASATVLLPR